MTPYTPPDGLVPTKVVAVHINYHGRAEQRGRVVSDPSYFLKPPSSLAGDGDVVRPLGAELLGFEGEVAVIIARRARQVTPEDATGVIGWIAAANDFGAHDFRWADRGSNVLAKGRDGYTPIGPPVPVAGLDLDALRLRTWVNGEPRQDDVTSNLIFSIGRLIADLSRGMTLEPGDIILTGTPVGAGVVSAGDEIAVEVEGISRVCSRVVDATRELAPYGALPRARPVDRAFAHGTNAPRPVTLSDEAATALRSVSTATLTAALTRRGIRNTFLNGLTATRPDMRMLGYATTLRYGAAREDIHEATRGHDAQKQAVESISPDEVLVIEARGETGAGTIGDILAARILARGGAGIVTDGGVRDTPGVGGLDLPTYYRAPAAASLWLCHQPLDRDLPVTCAGVLVVPGDVVVGDAEGVIVLPAAMAEEVALEALAHEHREAFALERVQMGESIRGLYPLSPDRREEYEEWQRARDDTPAETHDVHE